VTRPPVPARAAELVRLLDLVPHPEGGHFREEHRSAHVVTPPDGRGLRAALTSIAFLLAKGEHSRWHAVRSDEQWHWREGAPLELYVAEPGFTAVERVVLGATAAGHAGAYVVPAGSWQAARPLGEYTLVGCVVGPGFDFADFRFLAADEAEAARARAAGEEIAALI